MPYIQRDHNGRIIGIFLNPQTQEDGATLTARNPLPEDHPEIVAFNEAHSLPIFKPDKGVMEGTVKNNIDMQGEVKKLQQIILCHMQSWAEPETSMSALFQQILCVPAPTHNVARAAYYSLGGFDARMNLVICALNQFIHDFIQSNKKDENQLNTLKEYWEKYCMQ